MEKTAIMESLRPTYALIDMDRLKQNLAVIRENLKERVKVNAVVKANAYGHGSVQISRELESLGVDMLSVATVEEGVELREKGITLPILVMGTVRTSQFRKAVKSDLSVNVYETDKIRELNITAINEKKKASVHLKVDTGMGRIGFLPEKTAEIAEMLNVSDMIEVDGLFTNFAKADNPQSDFTFRQLNRYNSVLEDLKSRGVNPLFKHTSNTAGFLNFSESHFNMIRVGVVLYGLYPSRTVRAIQVKPVMSLVSHMQCLKDIEEGTPVGYGGNYIASSKRKIATIPIGYDDGVMRCLSGKLKVIAGGKVIPVIGNISMDMANIDITDIPDAKEGDRVTVLGEDNGNSIDAMDHAEWAGTISYEIICGIGKRVPRFYVKNGRIYAAASAFGKLIENVELHSWL